MATSTQISNYLSSIYQTQSEYVDKIVKKERLGHRHNLINDRLNAVILDMYVDIMIDYFSQAQYDGDGNFITDYNFFEADEIDDIILRINTICDANYSLEL